MLAAVIDRLAAEVPALKLVAGAAALAALDDKAPPRSPAAYVYLAAEDATPNQRAAGLHVQGVTSVIAVTLAVAGYRDGTGAEAAIEVEPLLDQVKAALCAWAPAAGASGFDYRRGRVVGFAKGHVWYQAELATDSQLRLPLQ